MLHPHLTALKCEDCKRWLVDLKTGEFQTLRPSNRKVPRNGPPPCETRKDICPKGHWENPAELTVENEAAYEHYRECRAVSSWPDDPIVRQTAAVIRELEDAVEKIEQKRMLLQIARNHD